MAKRLLAFISAPFISISRVICLGAGSSTRVPGVCPVSEPRRTHARVRRRREPDAKRCWRNADDAGLGTKGGFPRWSAGIASCYLGPLPKPVSRDRATGDRTNGPKRAPYATRLDDESSRGSRGNPWLQTIRRNIQGYRMVLWPICHELRQASGMNGALPPQEKVVPAATRRRSANAGPCVQAGTVTSRIRIARQR